MRKVLLCLVMVLFATWATVQAQDVITLTGNMEEELTPGSTYAFYDSGGPSANYGTSQSYTATFTCTGSITINFSSFATESSTSCYNWDYMLIYDGDATDGELLGRLQTGCASATITTDVDYVAQSGTLTIEWHSDASTTAAGWEATITTEASAGPTCDKPESVEANDVTANSATINWIGTAAAYNLQYKSASDEDWTLEFALTGNSYQMTNLVSNTAYQAQVQAICGENTSGWKSVSFSTLIGLPYAEHFNSSSAPSGWTIWSGQLQTDGSATRTTISPSSTGWSYGTGSGVFDSHVKLNIYGTSCYKWLITPAIPIPEMEEGDAGYQMSFNMALTKYSGTLAEVDKTQQQDDRFIVLASIDEGTNWAILREWNNTGSQYVYNDIACSAEGEEVVIDLSAYGGRTILLAFYGQSTLSGGDNYLHIDDVLIDEIPTCLKPTDLHALDAQATSTTLPVAWTANSGETNWRLQYKPTADDEAEWFTLDIADNPSYTITGLSAFTEYEIRVAAVCTAEDFTDYGKSIIAKTAAVVPFLQTFDTTTMPVEWKRYEALLEDVDAGTAQLKAAKNGWDVGTKNGVFNNEHLYLNIKDSTDYWLVSPVIEMQAGYQLTFDLALTTSAGAKITSGEQNDDKFIVFISTDGGANWTALGTWDNATQAASPFDNISTEGQTVKFDLSAYAGMSILLAFYGESTVTGGNNNLHISNLAIDLIPACERPLSITLGAITGATAQITWDADEEGTWEYGYVANPAADFAPAETDYTGTATDMIANLSGLSETTDYIFFVRRACSETEKSEPLMKAFKTIQTPAELPYDWDFESGNGWLFFNGELTNKWVYGTATSNSPTHALYISNDNGLNYAYSHTYTMVYATKTFYFPEAGMYSFSFNWKASNDASYDYLRVALAPAATEVEASSASTAPVGTTTLPEGWIALDGGSKLSGQTDWQRQLSEVDVPQAGYYKVIIAWRNNTYTGETPGAIDNFKVSRLTCRMPSGLEVGNITASTASLSWNDDEDGMTWEYACVPAGQQPTGYTTVAQNSLLVEGLTETTRYDFYLRKYCGEEDQSEPIMISFQTKQLPAEVGSLYADDFEDGNNWMFINSAKHGWVLGEATHNAAGTHAMYVSKDNGATNSYNNSGINIVYATKLFHFANGNYIFKYDWLGKGEGASTYDWDYLRVALVPAEAELEAGVVPTGFKQNTLPTGCIALDGGSLLNLQETWQTVTTDEIAVQEGDYMVVFAWKNDGSTGSDPAAAVDNFSISRVVCATPSNFAPNETTITTTSVELRWTPMSDETNWVIRYKEQNAEEWTIVPAATDTFKLIEGLEPATIYKAQIATQCDPEDATAIGAYSDTIYFVTACEPAATVEEDFEGDVLCWSALSESYQVYTYPTIISSADKAYEGDRCIYFLSRFAGTPVDQYAVLPELISLDNMRIKFMARKEDATDEDINIFVGVLTDPTDSTTFESLETIALNSNEYAQYIVPFTGYAGAGRYIAIKMPASTVDYATLLIDNVVVEEIPGCLEPTGLVAVADSIKANSAVLSWIAQGEETNWLVRYKKVADEDWNAPVLASDTALKIENLEPATAYEAQVAAWCDPTNEEAKSPFTASVNFSTIYGVPFLEEFGTAKPADWNLYTGWLDSIAKGVANLEAATSGWNFGAGNGVFDNHARTNIYGTSWNKWLVTPAIEMQAGVQLTFDLALTTYSGTPGTINPAEQQDDRFFVLFSLDNGAHWDSLRVWNNQGSEYIYNDISTAGQEIKIALHDSLAGKNVMFAFYGESHIAGGDNNLHIDNVKIAAIPSCERPKELATTAVAATSVTLDWTPQGEETAWLIQYKKSADEEWTALEEVITAHPYTLQALLPATIYEVKVAAKCSDEDVSEYSKAISFTTECEAITTFPYKEGFDSIAGATGSHVLPVCWNYINTSSNSSYNYYPMVYASATYANTPNNSLKFYSYNSSYGTPDPQDQYAILPEMEGISGLRMKFNARKNYSTYDATVHVGVMTDPADATTFTQIATMAPTTTDYEPFVVSFSSYEGTGQYIAFKMEKATTSSRALYIDDIVVEELPNCLEPTGLAISEITSDGAKATWDNVENGAWKYAVALASAEMPAEFTATTDNFAVVNELLDNKDYIFYLMRDCGNDAYSEIVSASFHTKMGKAAVPFADDFEDGNNWMFINGGLTNAWAYGEAAHNGEGTHALYISNDGGTTNAYTKNAAVAVYAIKPFHFEKGDYVFQYDWKANGEGGYDYLRVALVPDSIELTAGTSLPSGVSTTALPANWIALDGGSKLNVVTTWQTFHTNVIEVAAGGYNVVLLWRDDTSGGTDAPAAVDNFSITKITCKPVSELEVTNITSSAATIEWTAGEEEQNAWQIAYSCAPEFDLAEATLYDAAANTYALAELETDTLYTVYVRANCGETDGVSTWAITTFRTAKSCQLPDNLAAANITTNSASISWNTYGQTGFNLRFGTDGTNWTDSIMNVESPYVMTELEDAADYYVQVQVTCDEENWSQTLHFVTLQAPATIPYAHDFESKNGWAFINGTFANAWAYGTAAHNGEGTHALYISNNGGASNAYNASPSTVVYATKLFNFEAGTYVFKYDWKCQGEGSSTLYDYLRVALVPDTVILEAGSNMPADVTSTAMPTNWIALDGGKGLNQKSTWQTFISNEIAVTAGRYNVVLLWRNDNSTAYTPAAVDNFSITKLTCIKPANVIASDVFARSAKLAWSAGEEGQTAWQIALGTDANFDPDAVAELIDANDSSYIFSDLTPETQYYAYVRANCGAEDGNSVWTARQSFKTTIACPAPTGLAAQLTEGDGTIATLTWNAGEAQAWQVEYSLNSNMSDPLVMNVTEPVANLTGLTPETMYYARVKANCGELDGESAYSAILSFLPTNIYSMTVNDGTNTNSYVPVYGQYVASGSTASQFIVPAADLDALLWDSITGLTFYASNATVDWGAAVFEVYMTTTEATTLDALKSWESLTQVMTAGNLSIVDNKMVVTLNEQFQYTGDNLLIGIKQVEAGTGKAVSWYGKNTTGASIGGYGTGNNMIQRNFLPKMTINYLPGQAPDCMWATHLHVSGITYNAATFDWDAVEGANWEYALVPADQTPATFSAVANNHLVLNDLDEATAYIFYLRNNCGEENSKLVSIAFSTTENIETLPYSTDFAGNDGWKFANQTNGWVIAENALFISSNGADYGYDEESESNSYATKLFNFTETGTYTISYEWKCVGENSGEYGLLDFLRVALVPAAAELDGASAESLPAGWIALDEGALYGQEEWQEKSLIVPVTPGQYRVAFIWINDEADSEGAPAAINSLSISHKAYPTDIESGDGFRNKAVKFIKNNHVYILLNGTVYTITGQRVEMK